jgi:lysophospholipase L1-like esterase
VLRLARTRRDASGSRRARSRALASAGALLGLALALEAALALAGFEHDPPPLRIADGAEEARPTVIDAELRWRYRPGAAWGEIRINSLGFNEREIEREKRAGTRRVICLGDSCTAQGGPPYSRTLHDLLQSEPPTAEPWEAFNMGVHGYSAVQGLRLFELDARELEPDVVTIYFGWNDHWLGRGATDRERMGLAPGVALVRAVQVRAALSRRRVGQLALWLAESRGRRREPAPESGSAPRDAPRSAARQPGVLRVPPEDFRSTLTELVAAVRSSRAVPLLITAPSGALEPYLVESGYTTSLEDARDLHARYAEITREVGRATGARVLDLEREFRAPEAQAEFSRDGIHFQDAGRARIAAAILRALAEMARAGELGPRAR